MGDRQLRGQTNTMADPGKEMDERWTIHALTVFSRTVSQRDDSSLSAYNIALS